MLDFNRQSPKLRGIMIALVIIAALVCPSLGNGKTRSSIKKATTLESAKRENSRLVYNNTLKKLLDDLKSAHTTSELSEARRQARKGFQESIKQDESYPRPYFNLAVLDEAEENWDEAIRLLEQFRQLDASSELSTRAKQKLEYLKRVRTHDLQPGGKTKRRYDESVLQAGVLLNLGLFKEAVAEAARAATIDDSRWEAYALTASALAQQTFYDEAIPVLERAIARAPQSEREKLRAGLESYKRKRTQNRRA